MRRAGPLALVLSRSLSRSSWTCKREKTNNKENDVVTGALVGSASVNKRRARRLRLPSQGWPRDVIRRRDPGSTNSASGATALLQPIGCDFVTGWGAGSLPLPHPHPHSHSPWPGGATISGSRLIGVAPSIRHAPTSGANNNGAWCLLAPLPQSFCKIVGVR
ncbi:hypothetical protein NDU88_010000 [Pleurodeles waltl]|uniref:Secreted protein n=1 Tax=Pleurodeles waltl TaxID=8319 RepID=A0AAV7PXF1_PLEWA|nr:hypothetical protein NDU88_010000 [Pleurodeles waltl]